MTPIVQDKRVSMGLNGDLYFSNVMATDAHNEYKCNARCRLTQTIQQKNPFILKVHTSECSLAVSDTHTHTRTFREMWDTAPSAGHVGS